MIYIFAALYCEAQGLIRSYQLEKNEEIKHFQVFSNEEAGIVLTITGVGSVAAAAAVGSICSKCCAGQGDFLLNLGTCAARLDNEPRIFLGNKLIEESTGRTFYPDMLYRTDFCEKTIITLPKSAEALCDTENLYDMEAAAVYQAGKYFFAPHRMSFLKVVSDDGKAALLTAAQVQKCMEGYLEEICSYVEKLRSIQEQENVKKECLPDEEWLETLATTLHCSKTMRASLRQYMLYCALAGTDYRAVVEDFFREKAPVCKDRREGKRYLEELRRKLL